MAGAVDIESLPRAYGAPLGSALLRARPEDFRVEELLGFRPSGHGEHLFLQVRKTGRTTEEAARALSAWLEVPVRHISYAGLKDRNAMTTQWFSVHTPAMPAPGPVPGEPAVEVLVVRRNERKLRRGALDGNRFTLTLREVDAGTAALGHRLLAIAQGGVPNYFGAQRFGRGGRNVADAESLLAGRLRVRSRHKRGLLISAARSYLFNCVLAARVEQGCWARALPGELVMLEGTNSVFPATREAAGVLGRRLELQDVHPTGPLPGRGGIAPERQALALEQEALSVEAVLCNALRDFGANAMRRALRVRVADMRWYWPSSGTLELGFTLPAGAFATVVVRELLAVREAREAGEAAA
ncbi:tRNA pseudouridine(13) synthase TruD [Ectothiorhodospiraceae bacterium WFHF3C12]|nr:tRNA pseudouridine(13) synthase TruD [Ectothiorhodospiraceae bacterium WFHF3C12]